MLMKDSFDSFFKKWDGKLADFDGYYGGQCYDLAQFWTLELGGHTFVGMYAKDIYSQPKDFYIQIPNSPEAVPQVGDIVVWKGSYNSYKDAKGKLIDGPGHVAVASGKGDTKTFEVFSQNDPTGSKCGLKTYKYTNVIGWLRKKEDDCEKKLSEMTDLMIKYKGERDDKDKKYEDTKKELARKEGEFTKQIKALNDSLSQAGATALLNASELKAARGERDDEVSKRFIAEQELGLKVTKIDQLEEDKITLQNKIIELEGNLGSLEAIYKTELKKMSWTAFARIKLSK